MSDNYGGESKWYFSSRQFCGQPKHFRANTKFHFVRYPRMSVTPGPLFRRAISLFKIQTLKTSSPEVEVTSDLICRFDPFYLLHRLPHLLKAYVK